MSDSPLALSGQEAKRSNSSKDSSALKDARRERAKAEPDPEFLQGVLQKVNHNGKKPSRDSLRSEILGLAGEERSRAFQAMQQTYGNRYVQTLFSERGGSISTHSSISSDSSTSSTSAKSSSDFFPSVQQSQGRSLEPDVRSKMESSFGQNLKDVRIHTDTPASRLSQNLNAQAVTIGQEVFFASGKYQPQTVQGKALLAHELVHTRQNEVHRSSQNISLDRGFAISSRGDTRERAAQHASERVAAGLEIGRISFPAEQRAGVTVSLQASDAPPVQVDVEAVAQEIADILQADPKDRKGASRRILNALDPISRAAISIRLRSKLPPQILRNLPLLTAQKETPGPAPSGEKAKEAGIAPASKAKVSISPAAALVGPAAISAPALAGGQKAGGISRETMPEAKGEKTALLPLQEEKREKEEEKPAPKTEPVKERGARPAESEKEAAAPSMPGEGPSPAGPSPAAPAAAMEEEKGALEKGGPVEEAQGPEGEAKEPSPEDNPDFQKVVKKAKGAAASARSHPSAGAKSAEAQAAAAGPANEVASKAAAGQVEAMSQAQPRPFDRVAFKAALMAKIESITPKNLKEADEFKESGKAGSIKGDLTDQVSKSKSESQGDVKERVEAEPDTSGIEPKPVTPLPPPEEAKPPGELNAAQAAPKPVPDASISLQEGSNELDAQMSGAGVTDEQLEKSNEPEFQSALQAKDSAKKDAASRPQEFRKAEQEVIVQARSDMAASGASQVTAMQLVRGQEMAGVSGLQVNAKGQDEQERARVSDHIQQIYNQAKSWVEARLKKLDDDVNSAFDRGAAEATGAFEEYVARKMKEYKDERYSGLDGPILWAADKLLGMPEEVNRFYEEGKALYLSKMDRVMDEIAKMVEAGLNESQEEIARGRKEVKEYVDSQPEALKSVAEEAAQGIQDKFNDLESSVNEKQNQLIDTLANKYVESTKQIDARIEEMKAANRGLVDAALDAVKGVIQTIINLKNMLLSTLARAASAIELIINDPIKFLGNLVAGVKQGLQNFMGKIGQYLLEGLLGWLFGALAEAGIQLPESFDLKGILSLVLQVLGLTYANIRSRAVKIVGEKVVSAMEKTAGIIYDVITKGPGVLWDWIKDKLGDLKSMILEPIKSFVQEKIIVAGITWLLGLLNPVGAFIKAVKAIYDIIMFFVERGSQIMALVNAVIDSVMAIATGNISVAANMVEKALAKAIPVAIGFLAALLGLGGISEKIRSVIEAIRAPINKAIDWVIGKAVQLIKAAGKLLGFGKKEDASETENPEHDAKVQAGLIAFDEEEKPFEREGGITREDAEKVAINVRAKHPIFKSIEVVDAGDTWNYKYTASSGVVTGGSQKVPPIFDIKINFANATQQVRKHRRLPTRLKRVGKEGRLLSPELQGAEIEFYGETEISESMPERLKSERQLPSPGRIGLGKASETPHERAHAIGRGFGSEFFFVVYAPRHVNQILQNHGIEEKIRNAYLKVAPGEKIIIGVHVVTHPGTMRLKSITYKVMMQKGKERQTHAEIEIGVSGEVKKPKYSLSSDLRGEFAAAVQQQIMPLISSALNEAPEEPSEEPSEEI